MLIACALDDWNEAELWRRSAEQAFKTSFAKASKMNDTNSLAIPKNVRSELDELNEFRMEDLTGLSREEREEIPEKHVDNEEDEAELSEWEG
jgi:hypothetical protein